MTKTEMTRMMETTKGIGVETKLIDGRTVCYFYEDFPNDDGISRALSTFTPEYCMNRIEQVVYHQCVHYPN